ncbi:unnamed protein product [Parnassius mnemosyne]|uniref:Integrase catalytic domain-containing protein n=1 Tax=Parnassius mnemosyne TaxID=213953 RepID=A0AAV1LZT2_9NEOP
MEYEYEIEYQKGKFNAAADALSRYPVNPVQPSDSDLIPSNSNKNEDNSTPQFSPLTLDDLDIQLHPDSLDLDDKLPSVDLLENDDSLPGIDDPPTPTTSNKSPDPIPNPSRDDNYSKFLKTMGNKDFNSNANILEHNESILKTNCKIIVIPTSIDLDDSNPHDDLTKYSLAYPIANATAEETCECLVHFISVFGIPKSILTDQGTNFTVDLFKRICNFLKIKQIWSSPYHPQTQGALERSHSTLKEYLKSYVNENHSDWHKNTLTLLISRRHVTHHYDEVKLAPRSET